MLALNRRRRKKVQLKRTPRQISREYRAAKGSVSNSEETTVIDSFEIFILFFDWLTDVNQPRICVGISMGRFILSC